MTKNQIEWYAKIILELRLAKGYTQEDLASDAGVNADTIYKIESIVFHIKAKIYVQKKP